MGSRDSRAEIPVSIASVQDMANRGVKIGWTRALFSSRSRWRDGVEVPDSRAERTLLLLACLTTGTLVRAEDGTNDLAEGGKILAEDGLPSASEGGLLLVGDISSSIVALSRAILASISGEV